MGSWKQSRTPHKRVRTNKRSPSRHPTTPLPLVHARRGAPWVVGIVIALAAITALVLWTAFGNPRKESAGDKSGQGISTIRSPDVHSLAIDPKNQDHIFFGSHAGIQESDDGGYRWHNGALQNTDAMSLTVSSFMYAAGHDVLQVSIDGGKTWQAVSHDLPGTDIHAFAQDPANPLHLFAFLVGNGIFSSLDGGETWAQLPSQPSGGSVMALATNGATLYAATSSGIQETRDGGASWSPLPANPKGSLLSLAVSMSQPDVIYAGTDAGLMKTNDRGQQWVAIGPATIAVAAVSVAPSNPLRVLLVSSDGTIYRSDDGGVAWLS